MSREQFDEKCEGCRPALLDLKTNKPLPPDSPVMVIVNRVWDRTTPSEREAYHRVCCQNSRDPRDVTLATDVAKRIERALSS